MGWGAGMGDVQEGGEEKVGSRIGNAQMRQGLTYPWYLTEILRDMYLSKEICLSCFGIKSKDC